MLAERNGRLARQQELFGILEDIFAEQPGPGLLGRTACARRRSCGEVQVLATPRLPEARAKRVGFLFHGRPGAEPALADPLCAHAVVVDPTASAPTIGQHSEQVLREVLGYDDTRIAALAAEGVFGDRIAPRATAAGD